MSRKQVGWYDGERVHQMSARPVGDVPQHLAHTAGWVPVRADEPTAPITLTPAMRADGAAIGACCDPMSLEVGDPA